MAKKTRGFAWTLNNYTDEEELQIQELDCKYLIYGYEEGDEGTPHLQGYIHFPSPRGWKGVKKMFPDRVHIEHAKGSAWQNYKYCTKDGEGFEKGERPRQGKRSDLSNFVEAVKESRPTEKELLEDHTTVVCRYPRFVDRVITAYHKPQRLTSLESEWFVGPPGTGKSYTAREENPEHYLKNTNKWWCGYNYEPAVIIEEIGPSHASWIGAFLKCWADIYPFNAEMKGSSRVIRPEKIIVTSNYEIEDLFPHDPALIAALNRRFKVRAFTAVYSEE